MTVSLAVFVDVARWVMWGRSCFVVFCFGVPVIRFCVSPLGGLLSFSLPFSPSL